MESRADSDERGVAGGARRDHWFWRRISAARLATNNANLARFNYTVAHDLKNPLVTIKNFVGLLRQDLIRGDDDRIRHDLERLDNAATWMQLLLWELFELSQISSRTDLPMMVPFAESGGGSSRRARRADL